MATQVVIEQESTVRLGPSNWRKLLASRGCSKKNRTRGSWHENRDEIPAPSKRAERVTKTSVYMHAFLEVTGRKYEGRKKYKLGNEMYWRFGNWVWYKDRRKCALRKLQTAT